MIRPIINPLQDEQWGVAFKAMSMAYRIFDGHSRAYTGTPYVEHCAEVAALTHAFGGNSAMVSAGWLHDGPEEGKCTHADLVQELGAEVADLVLALTDSETGTRKQRKQAINARLARSTVQVQIVKAADIISNSKSIVFLDPEFASVYVSEKRQQAVALSKIPSNVRDILFGVIERCERHLQDLAHQQIDSP